MQIKYQRALEKPIQIVTPDWVTDSIDVGEKVDEISYHPKLLNPSPCGAAAIIPKVKKSFDVQPVVATPKVEAPVPKPLPRPPTEIFPPEDPNKKEASSLEIELNKCETSLFDSLTFSDDDEASNDNDKKNILDQLNSQTKFSSSPLPWKQSPTTPASTTNTPIPTPPPSATSCMAASKAFPPVSTSSAVELSSNTIAQVLKPSTTQPISIEASNKLSIPLYPNVSIATPSISITPHSASSAILPQSLLGSFSGNSTSKQGISTSTAVTTRASQSAAIISTSEVDISYVSKQAAQGTIITSASTNPLTDSRIPNTTPACSTPFAVPSAANTGKIDNSNSHPGKPMPKLLGQPGSLPCRTLSSPSSMASTMPSPTSAQNNQASLINQRSGSCEVPQNPPLHVTSNVQLPMQANPIATSFSGTQVAAANIPDSVMASTSQMSAPYSRQQSGLPQSANQLPSNNATSTPTPVTPGQLASHSLGQFNNNSNVANITGSPIAPNAATGNNASNQLVQYSNVNNQGNIQLVRQSSSGSLVANQGM